MPVLPPPPTGLAALDWVRTHLSHLCCDEPRASVIAGGQAAADAALARLDLTGYARRRSQVLPERDRGATRLSPYIRHGLLTLPQVWDAATGPAADVRKFRDELLWQEYARQLYARLGRRLGESLRTQPPETSVEDPWSRKLACVDEAVTELEDDGWVVNQARMWLASHWTVRGGRDWRAGEDRMFAHLLDGSRAANRLGWQWTTGAGSAKPYGFARWQVERRAPELCRRCPVSDRCPVEDFPDRNPGALLEEPAALRHGPSGAGPSEPLLTGEPELVWLTAESLGSSDPALLAHPDLPRVFVLDEPLLARLRLSGKRLVFLAQALAELDVEVRLGDPVAQLAGLRLAVTHAPVPGFADRSRQLDVVALHPWPWLRRPGSGSLRSYSAWVGREEAG